MNQPKDVQISSIGLNTRVFRSRTWDRLKFEVEYGLSRGTTANSFIIEGDKIALIDPPGESFTDIFLSALDQRIPLNSIDYVILGHVNPNRSTTLNKLLQQAPNITFITSNTGTKSLQTIFNNTYPETISKHPLNIISVKNDYELDLGKGHLLEFITTPNPRYPDQLLTYDQQSKIFYTDKLFCAHVCGDQILDEGWKIYQEDRRYYFDCVIAPYATQIIKAIEKISQKNAHIYATSHGPLVRYGLTELTGLYSQWLENQLNQTLNVALIYASAYG
ncbi:MAG: FprA family A-type flavoprotein, partial [Geminocystis sp. GBBB08]|nr:FprA family A-type flavoprotein [Geminocystis sp. GBBB08]